MFLTEVRILSELQFSNTHKESYFDGKLHQYVGYLILFLLMVVLTFGLAYPWAITMMLKWKTRHTVIEGKRLQFKGTGIGLFGNYIKWWLLTIVTLGIYLFWLIISVNKWKVKHTVFDQ